MSWHRTMVFLVFLNSNLLAAGIQVESLTPLPQPSSNNAVIGLHDQNGFHLLSLLGLGYEKTSHSIHNKGYISNAGSWQQITVPGNPRLASTAVAIDQSVYLFGGYSVATDGSELSTAAVYRYRQGQWKPMADMPVPVDDTLALVYKNRYIYLISGWHDVGNVNLVQLFDTQTNQWKQATQWPDTPVFGHAGAITGTQMVVCDGVRIQYPEYTRSAEAKRQFLPANGCWLGLIKTDDPRRIHWQKLTNHPGPPRYRMVAATGNDGLMVFAGGSSNPYNYNGIGYNKKPATASKQIFAYNLKLHRWQCFGKLAAAGMDYRGMVFDDNWFYLVGGMLDPQTVSDQVIRFQPGAPQSCQSDG